jgi:hypothetical protein
MVSDLLRSMGSSPTILSRIHYMHRLANLPVPPAPWFVRSPHIGSGTCVYIFKEVSQQRRKVISTIAITDPWGTAEGASGKGMTGPCHTNALQGLQGDAPLLSNNLHSVAILTAVRSKDLGLLNGKQTPLQQRDHLPHLLARWLAAHEHAMWVSRLDGHFLYMLRGIFHPTRIFHHMARFRS